MYLSPVVYSATRGFIKGNLEEPGRCSCLTGFGPGHVRLAVDPCPGRNQGVCPDVVRGA